MELKSDWAKGYSRLGAAFHGLRKWDDAVEAYSKGKYLLFGPRQQLVPAVFLNWSPGCYRVAKVAGQVVGFCNRAGHMTACRVANGQFMGT